MQRGAEGQPVRRQHARRTDRRPELLPAQREGLEDQRRQRDQHDQAQVQQRVAQRQVEAGQHLLAADPRTRRRPGQRHPNTCSGHDVFSRATAEPALPVRWWGLQAAWPRDAAIPRLVQSDAGRFGAAGLGPLEGAEQPRLQTCLRRSGRLRRATASGSGTTPKALRGWVISPCRSCRTGRRR